jgi:hypothetical protein
MRCIYCKQDLPGTSFAKVEHIIPQSFGLFQGNLVLHDKVCDPCNQALGDELDIRLARDTLQGFERFQTGVKGPSEYRHLGARSKISFKVREGLFEGSFAYIEYSTELKALALRPIDQVGLKRKSEEKYDFFRLEGFPKLGDLDLSKYDLKSPKGIIILSEKLDEARRLLESVGIPFNAGQPFSKAREMQNNPLLEITTTVDDVVRRGMAKIAFDYLANWNTVDSLLVEAFDPIRTYIRYGTAPELSMVQFVDKPVLHDEPKHGKQRVGHIVTVEWNAFHDAIISNVSLFNDLTYNIILAYGKSDIGVEVGRGSFWNIASMSVMDIEMRSEA